MTDATTIERTAPKAPPVRRRPRTARERAMYRRRRLAAGGLSLVLVGALVFAAQGAHALISGLAAPGSPHTTVTAPVTAGSPVRLDIGAAGVSQPLYGAGLDEDGEIDPPRGQVMWYTGHGRAVPGDLGTAVIAGHASYAGEPDVFADLSGVREGDRVTLTLGQGDRVVGDVVGLHLMTPDELQGSDLVWGDQRATRRIALVTCGAVPVDDGHREAHVVAVVEVTGGPASADTPTQTVPKG